MRVEPAPGRTSPCALPRSVSLVKTEPEIAQHEQHDATLVVAALEDIHTRQATLEWLLEADLLGRCLV